MATEKHREAKQKNSAPLKTHLMRSVENPSVPDMRPASKPTLPYSPRTPKFAKLETGEVHLYTFTIYPFVYKNGSIFPPQLPGWYPDATHSTWHLTDVRILIEADEATPAEDLIAKISISVLNMNLGAKIGAQALPGLLIPVGRK